MQVPRPVTPADRESVALLAASLARPIAAPRAATVAATPVPPPARSPRPAPAPPAPPAPPPGPPAAIEMALVEAPPAPAAAAAPIPAPTGAAWSRAAGGLRVGPGSAPAVGVAAGVDSARGWRIGLAAHAWGPATAARVPVRARAAGGELLLGRAWAPGALELGLGAEGRALASGAAAVRGAVPTASASGLWYPGAARGGGLVVLARAHVDLRMTGVDTAAGVSRLAPVGVVVGAGLRGAAPRRPATFSQNP